MVVLTLNLPGLLRRGATFALLVGILALGLSALSGGHAAAEDAPPLSQSVSTPGAETAPPPTANVRTLTEVTGGLNQVTAELDRMSKAVERSRTHDDELSDHRRTIENILDRTLKLETQLEPVQGSIETQIRRLGPLPKEGEATESDIAQQERERLNASLREITGTIASLKVQRERANQLIRLVQSYRRQVFRTHLFERTTSPLSPSLWGDVGREFGPRFSQLGFVFGNWWNTIRTDVTLFLALAALIAAVVLLRWIAAWLIARYRNRGYPLQLDFRGRATSAVVVTLTRSIPPIVLAGALYLVVHAFSELPESFDRLARVALWAFSIFAVVRALARTVLATTHTEWRLVGLADEPSRSICRIIVAIAAVYAINLVLTELTEIMFAPPPLRIAVNAIASLALAGLLILFVRTRLWATGESPYMVPLLRPIWLKLPLFVSAVTIIAATLAGYIEFARFLSSQVVVTGSIVAGAALLQSAITEFGRELADGRLLPDRSLPGNLSLDDGARRWWSVIMRLAMSTMLGLAAAVLVLLQWGFDFGDLWVWFKAAFFGFDVGAIRISIAAILIAIGLFIAGLFMTRLIQRSLTRTFLNTERMEAGLAHSIRTGVGYAGFALSALVAVSYAGFNFTNLAIVAGALSVGIGFGLQSIVNNFVSGLILLAERPIQVGDWIVVGDKEGYVREISVRATVIETFDRASLIIPNSDLMTAAVTNWTYGNRLGRVLVRVGTSYDADPDEVIETLLQIGRNCSLALASPQPSAFFDDFGPSTLDFSLRIFIADINYVMSAQTELRSAIWHTFKEKDIEIAFPQLDVHLKRQQVRQPSALDRV